MIEIYSPNMLKTYTQCPRKYYFQYIKQISLPKRNTIFEKGKKIHALANYYLRKVDITRIETALTKEESEIWKTLLSNEFFQKECLHSEYNLSCKIDKYWIGGRIDAIFKDKNEYYILDYKTGSIPKIPECDYQTMVYLLLLNSKFQTCENLSFIYVNLKDKKNYIIKFTPLLLQEYTKTITNTCKTISEDTIFNCNNKECSKCEYFNHLCDGNN